MFEVNMYEAARKLRVNLEDLQKYIRKARQLTRFQREIVLEKADQKIHLNPFQRQNLQELILDLCHDRVFCAECGITPKEYAQIDSRMLKTAIADYLMQNQNA